jgi:hypothetical protein
MKLDKDFFSDTPEKTEIREEYKQKQKDFIGKQLLQNDKIMLNGKPVKDMTPGEAMKFAVSGGVTTVEDENNQS